MRPRSRRGASSQCCASYASLDAAQTLVEVALTAIARVPAGDACYPTLPLRIRRTRGGGLRCPRLPVAELDVTGDSSSAIRLCHTSAEAAELIIAVCESLGWAICEDAGLRNFGDDTGCREDAPTLRQGFEVGRSGVFPPLRTLMGHDELSWAVIPDWKLRRSIWAEKDGCHGQCRGLRAVASLPDCVDVVTLT